MTSKEKLQILAIFFGLSLIYSCGEIVPQWSEQVRKPLFSHRSGYYDAPFLLELNCNPGESIYYTLDSSEPDPGKISSGSTASSPSVTLQYKSPLRIIDRTSEPNNISLIETSKIPVQYWRTETFGFWGGEWKKPVGSVGKITVVKAVVYRGSYPVTPVYTSSYLVNSQKPNIYPIASISTDYNYLFGYEDGILVPGRSYDLNLPVDAFAGIFGNFSHSGPRWERPVHFEYFDNKGKSVLSQRVGLRIGGQARGAPIKALDLKARSEYGKSQMIHDFFSDGSTVFKEIKFRGGGSVWYYAIITDDLYQTLLKSLELDIQRWQPVVLYINGEYWGLHQLRDIYSENYLQQKYGLTDEEKENIDLFENTEYEMGDGFHYETMINDLKAATNDGTTDLSDEAFAAVSQKMDMENFIDYSTAIFCFGSQIYPNDHNDKRWRLRTSGGSGVRDGRWRWMVIDGDEALLNPSPANLSLLFQNDFGPIKYLSRNEKFRLDFINRVSDFMNSILKPTYVAPRIRELTKPLLTEIDRHIARWGYGADFSNWLKRLEKHALLRSSPGGVYDKVQEFFNTEFTAGITGTAQLTVSMNDQAGGMLQVNRLKIRSETPGTETQLYPWSGKYFMDIPITVKAYTNPGYRFRGWIGSSETTPEITITLVENKTLTAIYEKEI